MSSEKPKQSEPRLSFGFALWLVVCLLVGVLLGWPVASMIHAHTNAYVDRYESEARWELRLYEAQKSLEEARLDARNEEARAMGKGWVRAQETKSETEAILARAKAHKEAAHMLEPYLSRTFLLYRQVEQNKCPVIPETPATKVADKSEQ